MWKAPRRDSVGIARLCTLLLVPPLLLAVGCTNLDETPTSSIAASNFYRNGNEVLGGLAGVYATMRDFTNDYWNVSEISSDEQIVPTRGQDWYDNGTWLELDRQTWGPNSTSGLAQINGAWNALFAGVARANVVLSGMDKVSLSNKAQVTAELRALRAFYYYLLMDLFGGVPIATTTEVKARPRATRAETFKFIEDELKAAEADLPAQWPADQRGRLTKGAVDAILASMYLNAEVWTGTVTTAGLQKGQPRWQDAVTMCDKILNSGVYSLASNWRSNFTSDNHSSPENIMTVDFQHTSGLGLNYVMRSLHYSQFNPSPWNGFATIADVYNAFDAADQRRQIFLIGPQFDVLTGQPVKDRQGNPLVFTLDIPDPTQATEGQGVRVLKFPPDPGHVAQDNGNNVPVFRLGEIYLIKAEALNELGQTAAAVALVNVLRARVFSAPKPLDPGQFTQASFRAQMLKERLFELTTEGKRRQDQIRLGVYTQQWGPTLANGTLWKKQTEPFRILMPIPQSQLDTNPLLTQNPGY